MRNILLKTLQFSVGVAALIIERASIWVEDVKTPNFSSEFHISDAELKEQLLKN